MDRDDPSRGESPVNQAQARSADQLPDESIPHVEGLAKLLPPVRGGVKATRLLSLDEAWKRVRANVARPLPEALRLELDELGDGFGAVIDQVLRRKPVPFPDAATDAGRLVVQFDSAHLFEKLTLVDVLLATGGVPYAVVATASAAGWVRSHSANQLIEGDPCLYGLHLPRVTTLRKIVCGLGEAEYAAALGAAAGFDAKYFSQHLALAYTFPEESGFRDAALEGIRAFVAGLPKPTTDQQRDERARLKNAIQHGAHLLLVDLDGLEDVELAAQVSRRASGDLLPPLSRLGALMTPLVMKRAVRFAGRTWTDKSEEAELATLLAATPSDEPIDWLIEHMDRPRFSEGLSHAGKYYPVRVLSRLGPVATGRGAVASRAQGLMAQILGQHPSALQMAKEAWDEETRRKVEELLADEAAAPAADVASLPSVFAEPRWTRKRAKSKKHKPVELALLEHELVFRWPECARKRWLQKPDSRMGFGMFKFAPVTEDTARPLIKNWSSKYYYWTDGWEQQLVARFEEDAHHLVRSTMKFNQVRAVNAALPFGDATFALPVADAYMRLKSARQGARAWLLHHPEVALIGLIPALMGGQKKARDAARRAIALLVGEGHGALLIEVASRYGDEAKARAVELSTLDALDDVPKKLPTLPSWCAGVVAPELKTGGSLPAPALGVLLTMLAISKPGDPYAGVELAIDALTRESLCRFSWSLFEAWRLSGMESKHAWAFHQLGLIGGDECARQITPILRKWPGEGSHARATQGLDILTEIGTEVALVNLYAISQKLKFKGLKNKAAEKVQEVADARGLSKRELADRLVPNFDLDEKGSMTLDFGPRRFEVVFDERLKPVIRDERGKVLKSLPKVGAKDDAEKGANATTRFKQLKKDVKAVAEMQLLRLEDAMCTGRTWSQEDFQRFLVGHPLLIHVVRRLIWGVIEDDEKVTTTFRVAEDSSFTSADDDTITLPPGRVGLMHPLQLSESSAAKWGDFIADYELLQPFDQLARTTYALTRAELKANAIARFHGLVVPTGNVLKLEKSGWRRGEAQEAGCIFWMHWGCSAGSFILPLDPGMIVGMPPLDDPEQRLGTITLTKDGWGEDELPLSQATKTLLSEVIRSLDVLSS